MTFENGDRVRLKNNQDGHGIGLTGTLHINEYAEERWDEWFIEFDEIQPFGHNADGSIPVGYGWFVNQENLEPEFINYKYNPEQTGDMDDDV